MNVLHWEYFTSCFEDHHSRSHDHELLVLPTHEFQALPASDHTGTQAPASPHVPPITVNVAVSVRTTLFSQ